MIVDIHTHTFPDKIAVRTVEKLQSMSHTHPFTDGTVQSLRAAMATAGVDRSVVVPVATNAHQVPHVNDASIALNEQGDGVLSDPLGAVGRHVGYRDPALSGRPDVHGVVARRDDRYHPELPAFPEHLSCEAGLVEKKEY